MSPPHLPRLHHILLRLRPLRRLLPLLHQYQADGLCSFRFLKKRIRVSSPSSDVFSPDNPPRPLLPLLPLRIPVPLHQGPSHPDTL